MNKTQDVTQTARLRAPEEVGAAAPARSRRLTALWYRKVKARPVRCVLLSVAAILCGIWLTMYGLSDREAAVEAVRAYLAGLETSVGLFFLRSGVSLLPFWLMLVLSGLCIFSGALSNTVLILEGLCDGAVLGALVITEAVQGGHAALPVLFAVRMLCLLALRCFLAVQSRSVAASLGDPAYQLDPGTPGISPLMLRHMKVSLAVALIGLCVHGGYVLLLSALL